MNKSKFAKFRKGAVAALCAVAVTCTGLAAACSDKPASGGNDSSSSTPRKEDTQLLKNGDFEYANVPEKAVHLIKSVPNWSRSGDSSGAMSGIINTSDSAWEKMTAYDLKDRLDANNDLNVGDSDYKELYVDYNGMDSGDILYIDPYVAALSDSKIGDNEDGLANDDIIRAGGKQRRRSYMEFLGVAMEGNEEDGFTYSFIKDGRPVYLDEDSGDYYFDEEFEHPVRYEIIKNPETHLGSYDPETGKFANYDGYDVLLDDDGNYYFDVNGNGEVDILEDESVGNVLMIHNYPTSTTYKYNGIEQHYTSQSITLEANTAAEISVWVKTSDLKFDSGYLLKGDPVIGLDQQDRGAYIEVTQSVAGHAVDSFMIKAINTEKIIADNEGTLGENESNGWLKYTIYVNACDFADSSITINLGLGGKAIDEKINGYAFFDDVEVKKFIDFDDVDSEGNKISTYSDNESKLMLDDPELSSYCSLISDADEKIFIADKQTVPGNEDPRFSTRFHYLIDLASENFTKDSNKNAIAFDSEDLEVSAALTTSETSGKIYASAKTNSAYVNGPVKKVAGEEDYLLPEAMKTEFGRPTFNDLIGIYGRDKEEFTADDFDVNAIDDSGRGYPFKNLSANLAPLTGESGLAALEKFSYADGSMLLTLSAYGAAYTTTIESGKLFTVADKKSDEGAYKIISFWVKTSDMKGSTAATIKIVDVADEDNYAVITVDSTDITTDIGDEENIYNGWVQCFFFVKNDTKEENSFKLEFSFGNTNIENTSGTSYKYGWAAMANIQSLDVTEDVFEIVSESTYSKLLTFTEEAAKSHTPFDEATRMRNVKNEVGTPSSYYGVNGGSSYVSDKEFGDAYDKQNNHPGITGLINREGFEDEKYDADLRNTILNSFVESAANWNDVFGEQCYQPLIIIDSLREYYDRATTTEEYFEEHKTEFYILGENGYEQLTEDAVWDEDETYYSKSDLVKNYGYIGNNTTVSSGSYRTVSVKVMVSGNATAWVYLVDSSSYDVMSFEIPEYTYYYDDEGNVLSEKYDAEWKDAEHLEKIVYTLRNDGLYEDADGGLHANLSNLTRKFKFSKFEDNIFYTEEGKKVSYDNLEDGVIYYNEDGEMASHYLCVGSQRVYEYDASKGAYYYLVEGKRSVEVTDFNTDYARPYNSEKISPFAVEITNTNGEWVTVNFIIHAGNEAKNYRLELWSGKRDETGVTEGMTKDSEVNGAVAFDIANSGITESNASTVVAEYETKIKDIYKSLIFDNDGADQIKSDMSIGDLEGLLEDLGVNETARKKALSDAGLDEKFVAEYYTFSWYDSAQFVPFNRETAQNGQTGYEYKASSYSETLVYFKTFDYSDNSHNVYVDYSAIDQTISINSTSDNNGGDNPTTTDNDGESPWLLITSIVLVAVLVFVMLAILARYLWKGYKKKRGQKQMQKNNYRQRERYIRKLGLQKTAPVEEDVKEVPAENTEAPSTEEAPVEEAPAEEVTTEEAPAEEVPTEETPAEGENKDE